MRGGGQLSCSTLTLKSDEARELPLGESEQNLVKNLEKSLSTRNINYTKNIKTFLIKNVFSGLTHDNDKRKTKTKMKHPANHTVPVDTMTSAMKRVIIKNSIENGGRMKKGIANVIAGLTRNRRVSACEGFTLAEVLITLGIIGIVAVMTLPTVIAKYKEKATVSQLKKVYSVLSQAYSMAVLEYGSPETWGMSGMYDEDSHIIMAKKLSKHMKLLYSCIDSDSRKCRNLTYESNISRPVVLSDGTYVSFRLWSGNCTAEYSGKRETCGEISVDLNGNKLPNKGGEDKFNFYLNQSGITPFGLENSSLKFEKACNRTFATPYPKFWSGNMYACTGWVIYNENMDYLHCDDLSWKGKKKCK